MKKNYEKIIASVEDLIKKSEEIKQFLSKNFDDLTIKEVKGVINTARDVVGRYDTFVSTDLYHILGMGHLTAAQLTHLTKLVEKLGSYRGLLHNTSSMQSLGQGKLVPTKNHYSLNLTSVTLGSTSTTFSYICNQKK